MTCPIVPIDVLELPLKPAIVCEVAPLLVKKRFPEPDMVTLPRVVANGLLEVELHRPEADRPKKIEIRAA